jgi:DNA helicase HerA-like ATPase
MLEIFKNLKWIVDDRFKRRNEMVNALVVLDEAPRWVPQFDEAPVSEHILDAIRTTRKQGLGWTFISQRLASIHKDILSESHTKWFGRNLGTGADAAHLLEALGKAGMQVYESLSHQGGYYWLIVGLDVNLGVGKTFMSLVTPGGNATEAIIAANPHIWR